MTAKSKPAPKVVYLTLEGGKPYTPRVDHNESAWTTLQAAIAKGVPYSTLRNKKDTPVNDNGVKNYTFAAYCVRRNWVKETTTAPK